MNRLQALVHLLWAVALCFIVWTGSTPLLTFSEALVKDCTVGVPERPKGPHWHLEWVK